MRHRFGRSKFWDSIFFIMMIIYIIAMQYRLFVDGYGLIAKSYNRYKSNRYTYTIVTAEVIDVKKHILAGLDGIIESDIYYCTVKFDYDNREYNIYTKVIPDCSVGQKIDIAVSNNDPQVIERISPYGLEHYHWIAQLLVFLFAGLIYKFFLIVKGLYED